MQQAPEPLWTPSGEFSENSNLSHYMKWLKKEKGLDHGDYHSLWSWSVQNISQFWASLLEYFNIARTGEYGEVLSGNEMPAIRWFNGISLNYAEHIFRHASEDRPAIIFKNEISAVREIGWAELRSSTAKLRSFLRKSGISKGDRVVAYLPTIPEASISFLAANSLGAVWSSTSPDFGVNSVIDRFRQTEPRILVCSDGYYYNGKPFSRENEVKEILDGLPSVEKVVVIPYLGKGIDGLENAVNWHDIMKGPVPDLEFDRVPFSHPIWVLYSSGTTGLPKAITHGHGGILLEHYKYLAFHNNVKPGDRCFWYTTTGWMMWNYIQASWLCGGTVVLYDGSPAWPDMNVLWQFAEDIGLNHFGTSAGYITANMKAGTHPGRDHDLSQLVSIGSTGSPLPPEGFRWLYEEVKEDLWVASISGGSDVCSAFVGGNPLWPVHVGEIQCRALGCDLHAYDEAGNPVRDEVGEMVITKPMPSMPVYFWNDEGMGRYRESYFEMFPGTWRHGDWTRVTPRQGVVIYGRSDSTLNRGGVRIGTSEIYRAVDSIPEVIDSLIICLEEGNGDFYMPLYVKLGEGRELSEDLIKKVKAGIRSACSPRHVPDEVIEVPDIPYTISGKKVEMPVKKLLTGQKLGSSLNKDALRNPESLDHFVKLANERKHDKGQ